MLDIDRFRRLRPFAYHLTSASNFEAIAHERVLHPAVRFLRIAGVESCVRRDSHMVVQTPDSSVHVRDQLPLHEGAVAFEPGWDLARLVSYINEHVFFWPGTALGPIPQGRTHFDRYASEAPLLLRVPTAALLESSTTVPRFSAYNSGAPRVHPVVGRSPRGESTYLQASVFGRPPARVVELVFRGSVPLPAELEVADSYSGPWRIVTPAAA